MNPVLKKSGRYGSVFIASVLLLVLLIPAPSGAGKKKSEDKSGDFKKMTSEQLRPRMISFSQVYASNVILAADEIAEKTQNLKIYRRTLLWKSNAISAFQYIVMQHDSVALTLDLWLFLEQMKQYFENGAGKDLFGREQAIAVRVSRMIAESYDQILLTIFTRQEFEEYQEEIHNWAEKYPIKNILFVSDVNYDFLEWASQLTKKKGLRATVGRMDDRFEKFSDQIMVLNRSLFDRLRWQLELLLIDQVRMRNLKPTLDNLNAACRSLTKLGGLADKGLEPAMDEFLELGKVLRGTMEEISNATEKGEVLKPAMEDFHDLSQALVTISTVTEDGENLIDHIFRRLLQLLLIVVAVVGLVAIIVKRIPAKHGE